MLRDHADQLDGRPLLGTVQRLLVLVPLEQLVEQLHIDNLTLQQLAQELLYARNFRERGLLHQLDQVLRLVAGVKGGIKVNGLIRVDDRACNLLIT